MVADRDFLLYKVVRKDSDNKYTVFLYSVADEIKGADPKAVRAATKKLIVFEKEGSGVKVTQYAYANPAGKIPAALYNGKLEG